MKLSQGDRAGRTAIAAFLALAGAVTAAGCSDDQSPAPVVETRAGDGKVDPAARDAAFASARVWHAPDIPISSVNFAVNPPGGFAPDEEVECRFHVKTVGGTTPKFYCDLPSGETVKVKYGQGNPELYAEVAATRLLSALGFYADRMFMVRRVRCAGCPAFPFQALRCLDRFNVRAVCLAGGIDSEKVVTFDAAVIERRLEGRLIEASEDQGWAWFELQKIDAARGGSSIGEVDAFRLMAVFLTHWDNKSPNQRLICPAGSDRPDGTCAAPIAIMQDLGASFGPTKVDLHNWRQGRIWKDGAGCLVSMEHLPWGGGTFPEHRISEAGRQHLLQLLEQLSDSQLRDLFEASGITSLDQVSAESHHADAWIAVFKDRVQQIRDAGPCPS